MAKIEAPRGLYYIGIDCYDECNSAYCLCRVTEDDTEILFIKSNISSDKAKDDVSHLSRIFNAPIIEEN